MQFLRHPKLPESREMLESITSNDICGLYNKGWATRIADRSWRGLSHRRMDVCCPIRELRWEDRCVITRVRYVVVFCLSLPCTKARDADPRSATLAKQANQRDNMQVYVKFQPTEHSVWFDDHGLVLLVWPPRSPNDTLKCQDKIN